jgi:flagellar motor switch protein FliM
MAGQDVLSQEEVDALLGLVDDDAAAEAAPAPGEVRPIDLANHERIVRGRMPTLEMVNDRFARQLRVTIFNLLRRSAVISVGGVKTVKFSEYVHSLFVPTSLNLMRVKPLRGVGLLVIDPRLVFRLVDYFFGGTGTLYSKVEGRDFTATEQRVIRIVLDRVFQDLREAWEPVLELEFEYQNSEVNPQFANIVSPTEVVVVCSFQVDLEGGGGDIHVTLPYSMIEPIRGLLDAGIQSDRSNSDDRWGKALRREMQRAELEISSTLLETTLTLREVLGLEVGDVIPVDLPETVQLCAEGVPVLEGAFGVSGGMNAIKIRGPVDHGGETEPEQTVPGIGRASA